VILLSDLLAANPEARVLGPTGVERFSGFCFDSRIVRRDEIFVALRTSKADGHDFIGPACRGGAKGVLAQIPVDVSDFGVTCVIVPDTEEAIQRYAAHVVRATGVRIVGVGGSVGKTSTKEAVAAALGSRLRVFRTPANYSGRLGLPIALGGLEPEDEVAVLEMASGHFGEAALLAGLAPPEVSVVTAVSPVHMATFGSLEAVADEYAGLVEALPSAGLAVLNGDDPRVLSMTSRSKADFVTFGLGATNDYRAEGIRLGADGTAMVIVGPEGRAQVHIPWVGSHFARAALAAAAIARRFEVPLEALAERFEDLPPVPGRLRPLPGRAGSLILDDTYDSTPAAVAAAFDVLESLESPRKIAVLGDMVDLGEQSEQEHRIAGRRAASVADALVTQGKDAAWIAEEARAAGMLAESIAVNYTVDDTAAAVQAHLQQGAIVLAEGGAPLRMERVVAKLLAEPARAGEVLVRQEAGWGHIVVIQPDRPTWVQIDLHAIASNVRRLKALAGRAALMAVLKADAYGHGAVKVARTALNNGASWCGVACLSEAEELRRAGIDSPILVLGFTPGWQARAAVRLGLSVAVFDLGTAAAFSRAAEETARRARLHVKVDTGMHRLGIAPEDGVEFLRKLGELPLVDVEGVFTHFASADEPSGAGRLASKEQLARFVELLADLTEGGLRPPLVHAANSAALLYMPEARFDLVRPGIAMYGLSPSVEVADSGLTAALSWKSQVAQVRALPRGETVGYGLTWRAERPSLVATVPVGYADGFRRAPMTWRHVLVRGEAAPVIGLVSMDQTTVDVTEIPGVRQGDEVVLIGRQGEVEISALDVAGWLGTSAYEVVAEILPRVPRVS
jgi:alanine racemase